jgi:hypothetical protein
MNEGKKDRRDPIRTIKARNPVAKNATSAIGGGAAGAHKDKKKAMKQGEVKHKNAEYAESYESHLSQKLQEATVNPQLIISLVTKILATEARRMTNAPIEQLLAPLMKEYGLTLQQINSMVPGGLKKAAAEYGVMVKVEGMAEEFDAEYNDEAGMADNNLETLKRAVDGIDDVINTGDNLPEWCQEKIAVAKSMLVTVWDYMLSDKDGETAVSEASALEKFRKAASEREKKHDDAEKEMNARHARGEEDMKGSIDRLEKHVNTKEGLRDPKDNPCWKGYKPVGTKKKGGKTVPNCVPKEGWTHDSLAAELFETENTYEDRLSNLLNKQLGK